MSDGAVAGGLLAVGAAEAGCCDDFGFCLEVVARFVLAFEDLVSSVCTDFRFGTGILIFV